MRSLTVNQTFIHDAADCYVIAEIGHNHQGSLKTAKELFRAAKECGANAVKLQKRDNPDGDLEAMAHDDYEDLNIPIEFPPVMGRSQLKSFSN